MSKLDISFSSGKDNAKLEDEQIGCWEKEARLRPFLYVLVIFMERRDSR